MKRIYVKKITSKDRCPDYVFFWEDGYQTPIFILSEFRMEELKDEIEKARLIDK